MASQVAYKQIPTLIAQGRTFQGNSMSGEKNSDGTYSVKSYRTVILEVIFGSGEAWLNEDKYSPTTSHHQNVCRAGLKLAGLTNITNFNGERITV